MSRFTARFAITTSIGAALAAGMAGAGTLGPNFRDRPWAPEMVVLSAGSFTMGSSAAETDREGRAAALAASERPQHTVTIDAPVAIGKYHVTVAQFDRFVRATHRNSVFAGCTVDEHGTWKSETDASYRKPYFPSGPKYPAVCVTWDDASAYAAWLSQVTGRRYRLMHEEEWEYAARAGATTARWWGDGADDLCSYVNGADRSFDRANPGDTKVNLTCDDGFAGASPIDHFKPNPLGLNDMLGNAWQWLGDCFRDTYDSPPASDGACERRVIRGGSWHNYPNVLRAATRFWLKPDNRSSSVGFRVARDMAPLPTGVDHRHSTPDARTDPHG